MARRPNLSGTRLIRRFHLVVIEARNTASLNSFFDSIWLKSVGSELNLPESHIRALLHKIEKMRRTHIGKPLKGELREMATRRGMPD